jgi:coenzyme F420 hydrogenase subunit beta
MVRPEADAGTLTRARYMNVTEKHICVGCGVCAGVCPTRHLQMEEDGAGEYRPRGSSARCFECGLCLAVCPLQGSADEHHLAWDLYAGKGVVCTPETGYFLSGWSGGVRQKSLRLVRTSGGLATWVLARLLETRKVDRVICVASAPHPGKLFEFAVFTKPESLWTAARSSYYPVEISSALRVIAGSQLRTAVIGLPCVVKGIRRAQRRIPRLRNSIPVLLGLVCGQQRGKEFTEYLVRRAGLMMPTVRRVAFREKLEGELSDTSHFAAWTSDEAVAARVARADGYASAWSRSYFKQSACNYCDDVFAELADASFMDAWLPGFRNEPLGTGIAVARSELCHDLLASGAEAGALDVVRLGVDDVIRSQSGALRVKRDGVALQLSLTRGDLEFSPRVSAAPRWRVIARFRKAAENRRMEAAHRALATQRAAGAGTKVFEAAMRRSTRADALVLGMLAMLTAPRSTAIRAALAAYRFLFRQPLGKIPKAV